MPGLILVPQELRIGKAIEELTMVVLCSDQTEWRDMIVYISRFEPICNWTSLDTCASELIPSLNLGG